MSHPVILSAVRTPIGNFGGALAPLGVGELGAVVIKEAMARAKAQSSEVDDVIFGNVLQAGQGMNTARQASIKAGLPDTVPALTINRVCGSGLEAVGSAARAIRAGDARIIVAGGAESMSQAPYILRKARWGLKMGDQPLEDSITNDGLKDVFGGVHMGITAENIARQFGISRTEQDEYALESQKRVDAAIRSGKFSDEIVTVEIPDRKSVIRFGQDEYPRPQTTMETLAKLKPAFKNDGTVTAGNASGINDGAAAVIVASEEMASKYGVQPLARITGFAVAGCAPDLMGLGPIHSTRKLLSQAGLAIKDIDLFEGNEAFAAQSLGVLRELKIPREKINVNGGAIALGHPIGCSGTRILVTLVHEMIRRNAKRGIATLCCGGGMGVSLLVER